MALRCLIVDDNPPFLAAARSLLERQGLSVVGMASRGAEGLRLAGDLCPDVVLVDIDLGEESGLTLPERLRADGAGPPPPVILISTHEEQDYADLIARSGAIGFLPKLALSAAAVQDLLDRRGSDGSGSVSGIPGR
jgi:DNA-binding NarL/FixJ family response regulator